MTDGGSWIARTGQRGKALVALGISCLAPAVAVFAFATGAFQLAIGLLALAVLAFVAFAATIRCPTKRATLSSMYVSLGSTW